MLRCLRSLLPTTFFLALVCFQQARASILIPKLMDRSDRQEAVRILGYGTSNKILSDPYPLGGYSGLEVGVFIESLSVEDLARLGATLPEPQQDVQFGGLSIGKGVYNNLDLFLQWIPYTQSTQIASWGGMVRWGFYQASFLPLSLSATAHGNYATFSNQVTTRTMGVDITGGIDVNSVALYVGAGPTYSSGRFNGGLGGQSITDSGVEETDSVQCIHSMVGASFTLTNFFVAAQLDRYTQPVYSAQIGMRF